MIISYEHSIISQMLREPGGSPGILATDNDGTLVSTWGERVPYEPLTDYLNAHAIPLMVSTGVDMAGVMPRIRRGEMPAPVALATSVGTELFILHFDEVASKLSTALEKVFFTVDNQGYCYVKDPTYEGMLAWLRYDRRDVVLKSGEIVRALAQGDMTGMPDSPPIGLVFQLPEQEEEFLKTGQAPVGLANKVSFHFFADAQQEEAIPTVVGLFSQAFPNYVIVTCEEKNHNSALKPGDTRKKYCLDVLPVGKEMAARHVATLTRSRILGTAGDSGNDWRLLAHAGQVKIVVGGATPELERSVLGHIEQSGGTITEPGGLWQTRTAPSTPYVFKGRYDEKYVESPPDADSYWWIETEPDRRASASILAALRETKHIWTRD